MLERHRATQLQFTALLAVLLHSSPPPSAPPLPYWTAEPTQRKIRAVLRAHGALQFDHCAASFLSHSPTNTHLSLIRIVHTCTQCQEAIHFHGLVNTDSRGCHDVAQAQIWLWNHCLTVASAGVWHKTDLTAVSLCASPENPHTHTKVDFKAFTFFWMCGFIQNHDFICSHKIANSNLITQCGFLSAVISVPFYGVIKLK